MSRPRMALFGTQPTPTLQRLVIELEAEGVNLHGEPEEVPLDPQAVAALLLDVVRGLLTSESEDGPKVPAER